MIAKIIFATVVMGGLGVIFGCLLAYAAGKFAVPVDPRVTAIRALLPGANCGGCGYPGCDGYAAACAAGKCALNKCAAGGAPVAEKIAAVMGVKAETAVPMAAFVRCGGTASKTQKDCVYLGTGDCWSAAVVPGKGPSACAFGCLGFGSCVKACRFGALSVKDGVARVDRAKCTGCGACADVCPRGLIALTPKSDAYAVACANPLPGAVVRGLCKAGCIGCGLCARLAPDALTMKGALASVTPGAAGAAAVAAAKCPVKAIVKTL